MDYKNPEKIKDNNSYNQNETPSQCRQDFNPQ